ncbi:MAG: gamma-glutamyl-gamma-aminobutyrate hydrolase family protein [Patescibacteria group bacterium]
MPLIGITVGRVLSEGRLRHQCADDYVQAVAAAGGWPVLLPAEAILAAGAEFLARFDGFLLSGGGDLEPGLYGQDRHPATGEADPPRDQAELRLARSAVAQSRPILAICRGIQVLNVALGGDLVQDLPSAGYAGHDQAEPREIGTHPVEPVPGTPLAGILPAAALVNSFHHQAVSRLAAPLAAAAYAPDGLVEAVYIPGRSVLGVQWHPECQARHAPEAAALFTWLVAEAKRV